MINVGHSDSKGMAVAVVIKAKDSDNYWKEWHDL